MFSTTLKRNSKIDLSRNDLVKLVTMLEGELQAREIVIAVLKSERVKSIVNGTKTLIGTELKKTDDINQTFNDGQQSSNLSDLKSSQTIKHSSDPAEALYRDSLILYQPSFDQKKSLAIHNVKTFQIEAMLKTQRMVRQALQDQIRQLGQQYEQLMAELDDEKRKNRELNEKYSKEFDRDKIEKEVSDLKKQLEDQKKREKELVLSLVNERKHLVVKLLNEREERAELLQALNCEKRRITEMVEMLEDESKRSLQMEADNEKVLNDFAEERLQLRTQIDDKNRMIEELTKQLQSYKCGVTAPGTIPTAASTTIPPLTAAPDKDLIALGEGVRSSIVTQPVTTKVHSQSTVTTVSHPKASVAQPAQVKSSSLPSTILPPPSIPVPQPKFGMGTIKKAPTSGGSIPLAVGKTVLVTSQAPKATTIDNVINEPAVNSGKQSPSKSKLEAPKSNNVEMSPSRNPLKEKILLFEKSAENLKNSSTSALSNNNSNSNNNNNNNSINNNNNNSTGARKMSAGASGRVPPPVPPNKPTIKPVMPPGVLNRQNSQPKIAVSTTAPNTATTNCNSAASQN